MAALESPYRIEPLVPPDPPRELRYLAAEVRDLARGVGANLCADVRAMLADVVRVADAWHSGAIEGRHVSPVAVERAFSDPEGAPDLALEARALVLAHREVDRLVRADAALRPTSAVFLEHVHRTFEGAVPASLRTLDGQDGSKRVLVPGALRSRPEDDVAVGRHVPPASVALGPFLARIEKGYPRPARNCAALIAMACAHHRMAYLHPFPDGNGRVVRLMSHAMAVSTSVDGHGLWSLSRGLNRPQSGAVGYHAALDLADQLRRGDRDGRGNLSEAGLVDWCTWFLERVLEQLRHARATFDRQVLESRLHDVLRGLGHGDEALDLASSLLGHGTVDRTRAEGALGLTGRPAELLLLRLTFEGFVDVTNGSVGPRFPLAHRRVLFPGLFEAEAGGKTDP